MFTSGYGDVLGHVILSLAVITCAAQGIGWAFKRFLKQPPVLGEITAGLMLGPSLLGLLAPQVKAVLLPVEASSFIHILAQLGVVLFMFLVGLELDPKLIRSQARATLFISQASIALPFALGAGLGVLLHARYAPPGVSYPVFLLFLGVSLSITAFPVLARILTDQGVHRTSLGMTALACAAVNDATAWVLLALASGVAAAQIGGVMWLLMGFAIYLALMVFAVRPLVAAWAKRRNAEEGPLSAPALSIIFVGLLASALATDKLGVHALFGAFLFGVLLPHDGRLAEQLRARMEDIVLVLFLPAFFAFTGMRTQVGLVSGLHDWLLLGLIIVTATAGKFGGTALAAKACGMTWRDASALGVLMNTRGLMELIALNVGLDLGIISPTLFTMLVLMALVTTFATTPMLHLVLGSRGFGVADEFNAV